MKFIVSFILWITKICYFAIVLNIMTNKSDKYNYIQIDIDSLYNQYVADLYSYAQNLGFNHQLIMDAIHDIFCKICINSKILDNVQNIKFYLFRSLKNRLLDIDKAQKKYIDFDNEYIQNPIPFTLKVTIEDELIDREEQLSLEKKINNILNVLTNRQREIIYLRFIQGYDYVEISNLMNITVPACHKLMSKTLAKLKSENFSPLIFFLIISGSSC